MSLQDSNTRGALGEKVSLVIGVTGHRDLRDDELPIIRQRVRELFGSIANILRSVGADGE